MCMINESLAGSVRSDTGWLGDDLPCLTWNTQAQVGQCGWDALIAGSWAGGG